MIVVETVYSRPTEEVPWYHETWTQEMISYIADNYGNVNKVDGSINESEDKLTLTIIHIFTSSEDKDQWDNDEYLKPFREERENYNTLYNIVLVDQKVE